MGLFDRLSLASRALVGTLPASLNPNDPNPSSPGRLLSGVLPGGTGMPPKRGTREFLEAYSSSPLLRMVTARIADAVAAVPWKLFVYKPGGIQARRHDGLRRLGPAHRKSMMDGLRESGDLQEIESHPFLDVLDKANEYHTGHGVRKISQVSIDTIGEFFWLKERNGLGAPTGIWPIPAQWVIGTPTPTHRFFRVSWRGWTGEIPDTEIFWAMDLDPSFPYGRGTGTGNALTDDLEADKYAAIMAKSRFYNQMRPDFLVTSDGLSDADTRRLERDWARRNQGFWNAAKAYFLNREVKVHEFDVEFRAQQFVQLREFERTLVTTVFGVPPEILGQLDNSNRATITAAETIFSKYVLVPRLEFWRSQLQERFLPEYDDRLLLDYVSPVPDDVETELEAAKMAPWAMSLDEWRARMGLEPIPDGKGEKVYVLPLGSTVTAEEDLLNPKTQDEKDQMAADLAAQAPVPPAGGNGNGGPPKPKPAAPPASGKAVVAEAEAFYAADQAKHQVAGDVRAFRDAGDLESAIWLLKRALAAEPESALHAIADKLEPRLRAAFLRAVEASRAAIDLERIAQYLQSGQIDHAAAQAGIGALTHGLAGVTPILQAGFAGGGEYAAQLLTASGLAISFDLTNPRAQEWAGRYSSQLITGVSEDTKAGVRRLIEQAFSDGLHPYETARRVKDWVGLTARQQEAVASFASRLHEQGVDPEKVEARAARYAGAQLRYRAQMIARTETLASSNHGQQELWQQARESGLLRTERAQRVWLVTEDDRLDTRICEPMADQHVGLDEPFTTGDGDSLMVPPAHPNCLPGESLVTPCGAVAAQTERWYEGELIIILTAGGNQLRCTPQHPILTPEGWTPACLVKEGSYVVSRRSRQGVTAGIDDYDQNVQAPIKEIANTLWHPDEMTTAEVPVAAEDFHGDGRGSQVAVIRAHRELRNNRNSTLNQPITQAGLLLSLPSLAFDRESLSAEALQRDVTAAYRLVRSGDLSATGLLAHPLPLQSLSFGLVPKDDASPRERASDSRPANGEDASEAWDRSALLVTADQVLEVWRIPFRGHVYNLQTSTGWYIAQGIITHNCRCTVGLEIA